MFKIEARDEDHALVLVVTGDLDLATADQFCQRGLDAIPDAAGRPVVIDVAALTFMDSTGVGALVKLNRAAAAAGTALGLRAVSRRVAAMLHITGIDTVIALSDSHDSSR